MYKFGFIIKLLLFISTLIISVCSHANSAYFNDDLKLIEAEFKQLNEVEATILANPSFSITKENSSYFAAYGATMVCSPGDDDPFKFNIEGFLWGFLCCPVGFFIIPMNKSRSKDEMISFWIGYCSLNVISTVIQVILITNSNTKVYY